MVFPCHRLSPPIVETGMNARRTIALRIVHGATVSTVARTRMAARPIAGVRSRIVRVRSGPPALARGQAIHKATIGTR